VTPFGTWRAAGTDPEDVVHLGRLEEATVGQGGIEVAGDLRRDHSVEAGPHREANCSMEEPGSQAGDDVHLERAVSPSCHYAFVAADQAAFKNASTSVSVAGVLASGSSCTPSTGIVERRESASALTNAFCC
jgi:hypothetical protein